jgi:hypothetical protein
MTTRHTLAAALLTVLGVLLGTPLPAATTPWAQKLTEQALSTGFLGRLPPNVSLVLGLAKPDEGTDVRQLLAKEGHRIRTFNVSVANHADLVIFNVDAQNGQIVAYLLDPDGKLRQAVSYPRGGQAQPLAPADAKAGFDREKRYWSARAKKVPATAPAAATTPPKGSASPSAAPSTPPKQ